MYVQEITLNNVRQFENESFRFQPGFNLLVGENGAGKTTLLRSLLAVLGSTKQTGRRPAMSDDDIRLRTQKLKITADILDDASGRQNLFYEKQIFQRARRPRHGRDLIVIYFGSNEAATSSFITRKIRRYGAAAPARGTTAEEYLFNAERATSMDAAPAERFGNSDGIREFVIAAITNISERFKDFHWRFEPYDCAIHSEIDWTPTKDAHEDHRRTLAAAIMRYCQETRNPFERIDQRSVTLESGGTIFGEQSSKPVMPNFRVLLQRSDISRDVLGFLDKCRAEIRLTPRIVVHSLDGEFLLGQLSDGEQRLFSLFVDIARRLSLFGESRQIRDVAAIILIDEIDVHLHPRWQRKIVPALEDLFPACQFIATTHSPFVIQAVDRRKILRPDKHGGISLDQDANSIEDIVEDIQDVEMPQRSKRAEKLSQTAEWYFTLLRREKVPKQELEEAEKAYRMASEPFTNAPALLALLKVEQMEAGRI